MNNTLTKFLESEENEIITDSLVIKGNLLKFDNLTFQLSNISHLYAGKRKLTIPKGLIIFALISIIFVFVQPIIGILGMLISGFLIFTLYQTYMSSKVFLKFSFNSGSTYYINFNDEAFLERVRTTIEIAFNNKNFSSIINIAEQKVVNGDAHTIHGDNANINTGTQQDNVINSHNSTTSSDDHSTFSVGGDVHTTNVSTTIGKGIAIQKEVGTEYDWPSIELALQAVISTIKIDSPVKEASSKALAAAKQRNVHQFELVIKDNRTAFLSDLFQNTASGVLTQIVSSFIGLP